MPKIEIIGPTPEFEQAMKQAISEFWNQNTHNRPLHEPEVLEAIGRQICRDAPCSYEMKKDGDCLCFNEEQDNHPGHPEHG